jgi:N6-L-threonylcarbamoyladenine synthase
MSDEQVAAALPHLCASYQDAILAQLLAKTHAALGQGTYRSIGLSGGVGNNRSLRERLQRLAQQHKLPLLIAEPKHCGDNASMIAFAAWTEIGLPEGDAAAPAPQLTVEVV